jgi:hypothetical protein
VTNQTLFHVLFGVFVVLHGLIHLLYAGHSARLFDLKPGLEWPDGSWVFSRGPGDKTARGLAGAILLLVAAAFGVGGVATISSQSWARPLVIGAAALSTVLYCLLWNGTRRNLDAQGAVGIVINIAVLVVALLYW